MRSGFRPKIIRPIFSPVPDARSRCLSTFVALARQGLPAPLRYEPSHILAASAIAMLVLGFAWSSISSFGHALTILAWFLVGLAVLALLTQDKIAVGSGRPRLIRQLDEARRTVGLDEAILPDSLQFLEGAAQHWERIEHLLQAPMWNDFPDVKLRIMRASHQAMEDVLILECGSTLETGLTDQDAETKLAQASATIKVLADLIDSANAAMIGNPRDGIRSDIGSPRGNAEWADILTTLTAKLDEIATPAQPELPATDVP